MEEILSHILQQFTTPIQLMNIALFFAGIFILTWCAKVERKEDSARHDRAEKWAFIDGRKDEDQKKKSIRGFILTLVGASMALYGLFSFLANV